MVELTSKKISGSFGIHALHHRQLVRSNEYTGIQVLRAVFERWCAANQSFGTVDTLSGLFSTDFSCTRSICYGKSSPARIMLASSSLTRHPAPQYDGHCICGSRLLDDLPLHSGYGRAVLPRFWQRYSVKYLGSDNCDHRQVTCGMVFLSYKVIWSQSVSCQISVQVLICLFHFFWQVTSVAIVSQRYVMPMRYVSWSIFKRECEQCLHKRVGDSVTASIDSNIYISYRFYCFRVWRCKLLRVVTRGSDLYWSTSLVSKRASRHNRHNRE